MRRYSYLVDIYQEFLEDKTLLQSEIIAGESAIEEIDLYLSNIVERESADFKVFSPRNIEFIYKEKLDEKKEEKSRIEEANKLLYKKLAIIEDKLEKMKLVMDELSEMDNSFLPEQKSQSFMEVNNDLDVNIRRLILDVQEKERQRIARDLHDNTVQNLTHLIHKIEMGMKFMDQDVIRAKLEFSATSKNIREIIEEMRNIIFNLRPMSFDDIGWEACFQNLLSNLKEKTNMNINFHIQNIEIEDALMAITIVYIIKECCLNAIKHSRGSKLEVFLKNENGDISILVSDDGIGFHPVEYEGKGSLNFGIQTVKERVLLLSGEMNIVSKENEGTHISIKIPNF